MSATWRFFAACAVLMMLAGSALAHGEHGPVDKNIRVDNPIEAVGTPFGRMGSSRDISRTVEINMSADNRISPPDVFVNKGETIRFVIRNTSGGIHAFMLGTTDDINYRLGEVKSGDLSVEDGMSSRRVAAGRSVELIWEFTTEGIFEMACLVPGHADSGSRGRISVRPATPIH